MGKLLCFPGPVILFPRNEQEEDTLAQSQQMDTDEGRVP